MIAVFYIGENLSINDVCTKVFSNVDIINAPAFVVEPYTRESLAPPGISVGFWMNFSEAIDPS
jgi:hypothetical protein